LHDWSFGSEKFVASITARFLGGEACEDRSPGLLDRTRWHERLNPKQRQSGTGKQISRSDAAGELQVSAENAAEALLFLRLESCKPNRISVHDIVVERVIGIGP
jgi:hypothetical protein